MQEDQKLTDPADRWEFRHKHTKHSAVKQQMTRMFRRPALPVLLLVPSPEPGQTKHMIYLLTI